MEASIRGPWTVVQFRGFGKKPADLFCLVYSAGLVRPRPPRRKERPPRIRLRPAGASQRKTKPPEDRNLNKDAAPKRRVVTTHGLSRFSSRRQEARRRPQRGSSGAAENSGIRRSQRQVSESGPVRRTCCNRCRKQFGRFFNTCQQFGSGQRKCSNGTEREFSAERSGNGRA